MAIDVIVPSLGESISEAVISKWLKAIGEPIAVDEPIVDLETDKVSVALPSPAAGVLTEQKFAAGATVKVGEVIARVDPAATASVITDGGRSPDGGNAGGKGAATGTAGTAPSAASPAASQSAASPSAASVSAGPQSAGASSAAASRGAAALASARAATAAPTTAPAAPVSSAVPQARTLPPSVRKAMREGAPAPAPIAAPSLQAPSTPTVAGPNEEVVSMSPLRRKIAERLVAAQHTAAILTTFNEVDMTAVMALRAKYQDSFVARHGIKLGFMSFFVRACVESLKLWPGLNAELRGTDIIYKKHYDFGIAVGGGKGLVVPVVRNVDERGMAGIEKEIARLADKAKSNTLTLDELQGGTFSITNGGIYGSMMSTPLLNMPQTGILGMHNIVKRPMAVGDEIKLRPMMYLALSYDHRVVDGREAVSFLVGVKERIEAPERLMLEI
jgi:2-oxoglutarate dehydrogenase E2 component (dihydrolipoamide succinyltransferase)